MKRCSTCKQHFPADRFYKCRRYTDGLQRQCKTCNLASVRKYQAKKGKSALHRSFRYKLPLEDVEALMQVPACQCCDKPFVSDADIRFDHCHESGHVRGVICHHCNLACNGTAIEAIWRLLHCRNYLLRDLEGQCDQARAG